MNKENTTAGTAANSYDSKVMCGFCGTELIERPDCVASTGNPIWCPKCQCYPSSVSIGTCFAPTFVTPFVAIPQEEYSRLKKCETELQQYKAEAEKIPRRCGWYEGIGLECTNKNLYKENYCPCGICPKHKGGAEIGK